MKKGLPSRPFFVPGRMASWVEAAVSLNPAGTVAGEGGLFAGARSRSHRQIRPVSHKHPNIYMHNYSMTLYIGIRSRV